MKHTQQYLNECFYFDKDTGLLYRKLRPSHHFKSNKAMLISNSNAGVQAGSIDSNGYIKTSLNGTDLVGHRVIFMLAHGLCPDTIDHIDGNKANNILSNLREATTSSNAQNRGKTTINTSGYKGVTLHKKSQKWQAQITANSKDIYLGLFDEKESAYLAYCNAAKELHGNFFNAG